MAKDPRLTRSPQQIRGTAQDFDQFAKGEPKGYPTANPKSDPINDDAWKHLGEGGDQMYDVGKS
jgi:hypothetical protein